MPRRPIVPALLVVAAFSRYQTALEWGRQALEKEYGPVELAGPLLSFDQTAYYERTMGSNLLKQLWSFRDLIPQDALVEIKRRTNALEDECRLVHPCDEVRPLNLDPGYLVLGKFVLATTKDQAHRIYLGSGIFAEVTLHYQGNSFRPWEWTYADYRTPEVLDFLNTSRLTYHEKLKARQRASDSEHSAADPLS